MSTTTSSPETLFHPVEHAILADWLRRPRPDCARGVELGECWEQARAETDDPWAPRAAPDGGHICLRPPEYEACSGLFDELDNAVARICLEGVQGRLPQWSVRHGDGRDIVTRRYDDAVLRRLALLPRHVLEINWASSGPGYSWPECFYVTYLPFYDAHVVTASRDSAEVHGYVDGAIAWFDAACDVTERVENVLRGFWAHHRDEWEQPRWECVFWPGLVTESRAHELADAVWSEEADAQCPGDIVDDQAAERGLTHDEVEPSGVL